ncbi:phospho-2-dehydro-3-deoxyheptonate aldolase [Candidatus Riesia sp. GBBU]|nr:phospho-2-dehydro-3-deoxyheptonate aldolase [Candidatus Riesia sp. GBBU]
MREIDSLGIDTKFLDTVIKPKLLIDKFSLSDKGIDNIVNSRKIIKSILIGKDKRLLIIVGPCSIHDVRSTMEYAKILSKLIFKYRNYFKIVMRTYFEKPRTLFGWNGLISDPEINGSFKINKGLEIARDLLVKINNLEIPTATEFLDIVVYQYIADLMSWGSIGARTVESQIHRKMASAFPFPIGFKNKTNGDIKAAINAIRAAKKSQVFLSQNKNGKIVLYQTNGNKYGHIVMRGGKKPNYRSKDISNVCKELKKFSLPRKIIVDCSHDNCEKTYQKQIKVAKNVAEQLKNGSNYIAGIMLESFLLEGNQKITQKHLIKYGQSITDPCIGIEETKNILEILAESIKFRFL